MLSSVIDLWFIMSNMNDLWFIMSNTNDLWLFMGNTKEMWFYVYVVTLFRGNALDWLACHSAVDLLLSLGLRLSFEDGPGYLRRSKRGPNGSISYVGAADEADDRTA